jgi:asparagine synthase (glutamine-hydrolysing)
MSRKIRPQAVYDFFAYGYVPEPEPIVEAIHKLPAGCTITLDRSDRAPHISRYWAPVCVSAWKKDSDSLSVQAR